MEPNPSPDPKSKAFKRILRDLNEINSSPIEGLGLVMPDENDPFHLRANILILDGIYKGIILHMIMKIPETYPIKAPKMLIADGQGFTHEYHHHVFGSNGGSTICIDLLDHGFFDDDHKTGWTPAYTLSTILMQMQIFFSKDYDLVQLPSEHEINKLRNKVESFKEKIRTTDGSHVYHSFKHPYPEICSKAKVPEILQDETARKRKAYEKMTCYVTKISPEDGDSLLGYPMKLEKDRFGKLQMLPTLEILSYEGYMLQMMQYEGERLHHHHYDDDYEIGYNQPILKTASGCEFNHWFPLYTNATLYQKHKQHVLNAFSILKFGSIGKKKYDFKPEQILEIFPCLMNKMIVALQRGDLHQSMNSIEAYAHFLRLFLQLLKEFPEIQNFIDEKVTIFLNDRTKRNKKNLGDMGEFLILLAFSKYTLQNRQIWKAAMVETVARMFFWVIDKIEHGTKVFSSEDDKDLIKNQDYGNFFRHMSETQTTQFFEAGKVTNHLLIFNFTASQQFLIFKEAFIKRIDENYGVLDEKEAQQFLEKINKLKNDINTYKKLLDFLGLEAYAKNNTDILNLFKVAWDNATESGYIKINRR